MCVRAPVAAGVHEAEYDLLFGRIHARLLRTRNTLMARLVSVAVLAGGQ